MQSQPVVRRFTRALTPAQAEAVRALGASEDDVLPAAVGDDVFVYVKRAGGTIRFQLDSGGGLIGRTRFGSRVVERAVV